jgi:hypothetical protein
MEASNFLEALKSVNSYPIPLRTLVETAERRGLTLTDSATKEGLRSKEYRLSVADLLLWLSLAPNVTQGGQTFSFTDEQRKQFRKDAQAIFDEFDDDLAPKTTFGYKGSRL